MSKLKCDIYLIPLRVEEEDMARAQLGPPATTFNRWRYEPVCGPTRVVAHLFHASAYKGGKFKTVQKADHRIAVCSYGKVISKGTVWETNILGKIRRHRLPEGHVLQKDGFGLKIVRTADNAEWHISKEHRRALPEFWVDNLNHEDRRRQAHREEEEQRRRDKANYARDQKLFLADAKNTRVTMQDSRRVGNCWEGSATFARQLGFKLEDYNGLNAPGVRASTLLRTRDKRAEAAAFAAWKRETIVCI